MMIREEFIRSWEIGQENMLAIVHGGYIYAPYIIAQSETITIAGREILNQLVESRYFNDVNVGRYRWGTPNLGNVDGITVSAANK